MKTSMHRPSRVIVDLEAIKVNIEQEMKHLTSNQELFAVVKANGYGHGAVPVSLTAIKSGATGLCVSNLDEGLELRAAGVTVPILILSYVNAMYTDVAIENDLTLTVSNVEWLEAVTHQLAITQPSKRLVVHLKIDSGMGRIGLRKTADMLKANQLLSDSQYIIFEGIFTHFSTADSTSFTYFEQQQQQFLNALEVFPKDIKYIHTANSATALWHDGWQSNLIRFGDAMYGLNPSGNELKEPYPLYQALSLETELIHVKQLDKGEKIGYGATYETSEPEWIGTVPIGYADGIRRDFQGFEVLIQGQKVPIVGRVCMDQCMLKLPKEYKVGTTVTFFGKNKDAYNSIQSAADYVGTINYEIVCGLTDRLPRCYINE